ncbi:MAG: asparagine synthase (glutamine-hydrolyzing), partial [Planctomycetota bacterium]
MCGIAGIWGKREDEPAAGAALEPMLDRILHRGPDDRGRWDGPGTALGHVRLSILDPTARAHQPMVTPDGRGVLVYNGETYNFRALRRELEAEGVAFTSAGDTEVVLHALVHWGPRRAISRLNGMFAFAFLEVEEDVLWLARDRLGIKPLYVARPGSQLLFASEVKALLAHPAVERRPSWRHWATYLLRGWVEGRATAFEGVESLEPGSWWRVERDGSMQVHRHFHVLENLDVDRLIRTEREDPAAAVDRFERALQESVEAHLQSDVPLGTICSGGVDSSLITAYARDTYPDLVAYVADVSDGRDGEGEGAQARRVGRHLGVPMRTVPVDRTCFLRRWPQAVYHEDAPNFHPSDAALLELTDRCRRDGVEVLLTGEGSDELFGGYGWYAKTERMWRRRRGFLWRLRHRRRLRGDAVKLALGPLYTDFARHDPMVRLRLMALLDTNAEVRPQRLMERLAAVVPVEDRALLVHGLDDLERYLTPILMRHDRCGMAAALEMRVPFLENHLIDLGLHAPRRWKLHRGRGKWIVKEAAMRRLPKDVVHAPKKGFPVPRAFARGAEGLLRGGALAELQGWSPRTLDAYLALTPADPGLSFRLASLELWARIFFRSEDPEELG